MTCRLTIIVPAWRCEGSIDRSLGSLADQHLLGVDAPHLIVAVNDGRAESFAAAERHRPALERSGYRVDVITTAPGRRAAFVAAETLAAPGARLFLDQDARLTPGALAALARAAPDEGPALFLTFALGFTQSPSALVRGFVHAWLSLPYITTSPVVAGAFGVSRAGRDRWTRLPDIAADDKFVRLLFAPEERLRLGSEGYEVLACESYPALVRARARYMRGNRALARRLRTRNVRDAPRHEGVGLLLARPSRWPDAALLLITSGVALVRSCRP